MIPDQPAAEFGAAAVRLGEDTLRHNWREGVGDRDGAPFAYTAPSPGHYPWQWYWDSCFTAIAGRHVDSRRSRRELESLLTAQRSDGFIGHTIFWNTPLQGIRRFTYNVTEARAAMTATIQPPMLAWAWRIAVGDPALEPRIAAQHAWLESSRDLDGDGLIWIIQPDESGLDASPQFDPIWKREAHGLPGFALLVRRNRRLGFGAERIAEAGGPVCCEVMTNVLYSLARSALGKPSLTGAIVARMYDERAGLFLPLARPEIRTRTPVTWAALAPLALPDLPEEIGRRLVEEHLLDERRFWLPLAPASVAADEPAFTAHDARLASLRRYWRGPTWMNAAWLLWLGLQRLGYAEPAERLVGRLAAAVARETLREYYNPYTGAGLGARQFAWSALIIDMLRGDPAAARSYVTQPGPRP